MYETTEEDTTYAALRTSYGILWRHILKRFAVDEQSYKHMLPNISNGRETYLVFMYAIITDCTYSHIQTHKNTN